jgi:hypothetical protein
MKEDSALGRVAAHIQAMKSYYELLRRTSLESAMADERQHWVG